MAKAKKTTKPRPKKYEEPLTVKGSFMDIMNASVKNAAEKANDKKQS